MLFGILDLVFSEVVGAGDDVEHFPIVLLSGMVLYFFFSEVTGAASTSLVDRESLVRKVGFPRMVVPLAVTVVGAFNLLLNLVVLAVFLALNGVAIRWTWLLVPLPGLLVMGALATGVGMLLAALYVRFRDIKPIWDVVLQALFYATPILYPLQLVQEKSEDLAHILMASPLATLIQWLRRLLLGTDTPTPAEAIGGAVLTGHPRRDHRGARAGAGLRRVRADGAAKFQEAVAAAGGLAGGALEAGAHVVGQLGRRGDERDRWSRTLPVEPAAQRGCAGPASRRAGELLAGLALRGPCT